MTWKHLLSVEESSPSGSDPSQCNGLPTWKGQKPYFSLFHCFSTLCTLPTIVGGLITGFQSPFLTALVLYSPKQALIVHSWPKTTPFGVPACRAPCSDETSPNARLPSKDMNAVKPIKRKINSEKKKKEMKKKYEGDKEKTERFYQKVEWDCDDLQEDEKPIELEDDFIHDDKKKCKIDVLSPSLLSSLDCNALTDRRAIRTIAETAEALGQDPAQLNVSRLTLRRHRQENRFSARHKLPESFSRDDPVIFHWDGKRLPDETDKLVERLVVVAVDLKTSTEHLLGVVSTPDGTGK